MKDINTVTGLLQLIAIIQCIQTLYIAFVFTTIRDKINGVK